MAGEEGGSRDRDGCEVMDGDGDVGMVRAGQVKDTGMGRRSNKVEGRTMRGGGGGVRAGIQSVNGYCRKS